MLKLLRNKFDTELKKFRGTFRSVWNLKFVCIIRVTKNCEIGVLQAASIIGLSSVCLAACHEL